MGLFTRFLGPQQATFHSSGVAKAAPGGAPTVGATSTTTFSQRQAIDSNRQHIAQYGSAGIHYTYRQEARDARQSPASDGGAPVQGNRSRSSRIDVVKPQSASQVRSVDGRLHPQQVQSAAQPGVKSDGRPHPQPIQRASFAEPTSRGNNPYR